MEWKIWQQQRHILVLLISLGVFILYVCRVNLSVAIVAMTIDTYETLENGTIIKHEAEFDWSNVIQGYLLSSFFYGYVATLPIGALFGRKTGGKMALTLTVFCASIVSLISPWLAEWSPYALLAGRVFTGFLEGLTYPGIYVLFAKWVPESEKSRVAAQVHGSNYAGSVFVMLFYGYLAEVAGWRSLFWFSGALGITWMIIWIFLVTESPRQHPTISNCELLYIEKSVKNYEPQNIPIPFKRLMTSIPIWALGLSIFSEAWEFHTLITLLPKYFNDVYNFDLSKMGILSALPYILLVVMMMVIGQIFDRIIARKWFSLTVVRKLAICGSLLLEGSFMLGAAYWQNIFGNVFCLVMAVGLGSISKANMAAVPFDLSPQFSGFIYGIAMSVGQIAGIITPIISGYILSSNPTVQEWQTVFFLASGVLFFGIIVFGLFGSAEKLERTKEVLTIHKTVEENNVELTSNVEQRVK